MKLAAFCLLALLASTASAQKPPALVPGEYVTLKGWGSLALTRDKAGTMRFEIETIGANGHMCSLEGELGDGGRASLKALEKDEPCTVTIARTTKGVAVTPGSSACRYFCGMRAGFEGEYLLPHPGCGARALAGTRKEFQRLYDAKKFAQARAKLAPALANCGETLGRFEEASIRNDLAVTLHKLGEKAARLEVLESLAADAGLSEDEVRDMYPPADADSYLVIVRATRTNLRLCGAK